MWAVGLQMCLLKRTLHDLSRWQCILAACHSRSEKSSCGLRKVLVNSPCLAAGRSSPFNPQDVSSTERLLDILVPAIIIRLQGLHLSKASIQPLVAAVTELGLSCLTSTVEGARRWIFLVLVSILDLHPPDVANVSTITGNTGLRGHEAFFSTRGCQAAAKMLIQALTEALFFARRPEKLGNVLMDWVH